MMYSDEKDAVIAVLQAEIARRAAAGHPTGVLETALAEIRFDMAISGSRSGRSMAGLSSFDYDARLRVEPAEPPTTGMGIDNHCHGKRCNGQHRCSCECDGCEACRPKARRSG